MGTEEEKDAKDWRPLTDYWERLWGQALFTVSTAEEEAVKALSRYADAAGWSQEEMLRQVRQFTDRLTEQRQDLEKNMEHTVKLAMEMWKIPWRTQMENAADRLEKMEQRIDTLLKAQQKK